MEYRRFGSAGVKVSPICLGTAFRGRPGDDVCKATIARAIDLGVNFIDVANIYQQGLGVMTFSPLAVGLLSGRLRRDTPPPDTPWGQGRSGFTAALTPAADRVVATLTRIGQERGKSPAQVAIAWILSHPEISAAMIGPDRPEHVTETVAAATWELDPAARTTLDSVSAWAINGTPGA